MSLRLCVLVIAAIGVVGAVWLVDLAPARGENSAGSSAPGPAEPRSTGRARVPIKLAITVDDMPGGGPEELGYSHVQMVKDMVTALRAHDVPHAAGFVVGGMLEGHTERNEALDAWLQAGFLVGNHSFTHPRIADIGLARFSEDILRNRKIIDALEARGQQDQRYFRFPYLAEGTTHEERRALWQLLQRERYTLVRASVVFNDWDWADAYLRCQHKRDHELLLALDRSYLSHALVNLQWSVEAASEVFGRAIPHVLLLHVNVPTATNLDALLRMYEAHGVQFITLEEAMREPAYAAYYDVPGGDLITQASVSLGRHQPAKPAALGPMIERICR